MHARNTNAPRTTVLDKNASPLNWMRSSSNLLTESSFSELPRNAGGAYRKHTMLSPGGGQPTPDFLRRPLIHLRRLLAALLLPRALPAGRDATNSFASSASRDHRVPRSGANATHSFIGRP